MKNITSWRVYFAVHESHRIFKLKHLITNTYLYEYIDDYAAGCKERVLPIKCNL